jgi:hypothetical protein
MCRTNVLLPFSVSKAKPSENFILHLRAYFSSYSTHKIKSLLSSETSVNFFQTVRHHIPEDIIYVSIYLLLVIYGLTVLIFIIN